MYSSIYYSVTLLLYRYLIIVNNFNTVLAEDIDIALKGMVILHQVEIMAHIPKYFLGSCYHITVSECM